MTEGYYNLQEEITNINYNLDVFGNIIVVKYIETEHTYLQCYYYYYYYP